jgi:hypothetical protein
VPETGLLILPVFPWSMFLTFGFFKACVMAHCVTARRCEFWVMRSGTPIFDCRKQLQASQLGLATGLLILRVLSWSIVSDPGLDQSMCDGAPVALHGTTMRVVGDAQRHTNV